MNIGTKSVLYGAHCFFIHPWFVALAWWRIYGFPFDPRLWVAFFVHDLGYWGKPNMDGPEGESHPELGADIMGNLFDWNWSFMLHRAGSDHRCSWSASRILLSINTNGDGHILDPKDPCKQTYNWHSFTLYHSRFYSKRRNTKHSRLCAADKLATAITPRWLYFLLVKATGEIHEYMGTAGRGKYQREESQMFTLATGPNFTPEMWHKRMTDFMREWAWKNK